MTKYQIAAILAIGVLVLLAQTIPSSESVAYVLASLLGLLAVMVRAIFAEPKSDGTHD